MKKLSCSVLALLLVLSLLLTGCHAKEKPDDTTAPGGETQDVITADEMLSLWTADAASRKALVEYLDAISDESGPDFIPVEDRIAVFDLDGTLFCETDPNYFDYTLLVYRVLEDLIIRTRPPILKKKPPTRSCSRTRPAQNLKALRWITARRSPPPSPG